MYKISTLRVHTHAFMNDFQNYRSWSEITEDFGDPTLRVEHNVALQNDNCYSRYEILHFWGPKGRN